jgi:hypothetical protein
MKKISIIAGMLMLCMLASAQVYFYNSGLIAEYEDAPDSVVTIPMYRTPQPAQNEGALSGVFSVSPTRKVRFSKGNLQYVTATGIWRFAANQYDTVGGNIATPSIDLFGYGTSGWAGSGAVAYQPTDTSTNATDYIATYGSIALSTLSGYMEHRDWGVHNPISNGGNKPGLWRALTYHEMNKLLYSRWEPYAFAIVNGIYGIVLLPDDWDDARNPNDYKIHAAFKVDRNWRAHTTLTDEQIAEYVATNGNDTIYAGRMYGFIGLDESYGTYGERDFIEYTLNPQTGEKEYYPLESYNVTPEEWTQFENLGCVFLPFVTSRNNSRNNIKNDPQRSEYHCVYWCNTDSYSLDIIYHPFGAYSNYSPLQIGHEVPESFVGGCVRLVQDY